MCVCVCVCICGEPKSERVTDRASLWMWQNADVSQNCLSYDLMMKSRRQQTYTLERQQEQTTSILESESKTGEIVIYLSLFI